MGISATMEISMEVSLKTKNRATIQPSYTTPGLLPKGLQSSVTEIFAYSCLLQNKSQQTITSYPDRGVEGIKEGKGI